MALSSVSPSPPEEDEGCRRIKPFEVFFCRNEYLSLPSGVWRRAVDLGEEEVVRWRLFIFNFLFLVKFKMGLFVSVVFWGVLQ